MIGRGKSKRDFDESEKKSLSWNVNRIKYFKEEIIATKGRMASFKCTENKLVIKSVFPLRKNSFYTIQYKFNSFTNSGNQSILMKFRTHKKGRSWYPVSRKRSLSWQDLQFLTNIILEFKGTFFSTLPRGNQTQLQKVFLSSCNQ